MIDNDKIYRQYTSLDKDIQKLSDKSGYSVTYLVTSLRKYLVTAEYIDTCYNDKDMTANDIFNDIGDTNLFTTVRALQDYIQRRLDVSKHKRSSSIPQSIIPDIINFYVYNGLEPTYSRFKYSNTIILSTLRKHFYSDRTLYDLYTIKDTSLSGIQELLGYQELFSGVDSLRTYMASRGVYRKYKGKSSYKHLVESSLRDNGNISYNSTQTVKEKTRKTNLARYGVTTNLNLPGVRSRAINTIVSSIPWVKTKYVNSLEESLTILGSKSKLSSFIDKVISDGTQDTLTVSELAIALGLSYAYVIKGRDETAPFHVSDYSSLRKSRRGMETEIGTYLDSLGVSYKRNTRPDFMNEGIDGHTNLEIDYLIPDYHVAIEFNGYMWHSLEYGKSRYYHEVKKELCRKAGINLIHVWEYDWTDPVKRDIIKSQIAYSVKSSTIQKINARSLRLDDVSKKDSDTFLEHNHIQGGNVNGNLRYGLYDKGGSLISIMVLGRKRYNTDNNIYELQRFATKRYTAVRGAASKLFSHLLADNPSIRRIESFANNDFAHDQKKSVYTELGFTYISTAVSRYKWVSYKGVVSRFSVQKSHLRRYTEGKEKEPFPDATKDFSSSDTERSYMERNGYVQVYNAGNDKYVYTR